MRCGPISTPTSRNRAADNLRRRNGRPSKKVVEKQIKRTQHLLDIAAQLIADIGFKTMTMDALANEAGVNKATLYYYFGAKSNVLFDICEGQVRRACELTEPAVDMKNSRLAINHVISASVHLQRERRYETRVFYQERPFLKESLTADQFKRIAGLRERYANLVQQIVEMGVQEGVVQDQNARVFSDLILSTLRGVHETMEVEYDDERLIVSVQEFIANGIFNH